MARGVEVSEDDLAGGFSDLTGDILPRCGRAHHHHRLPAEAAVFPEVVGVYLAPRKLLRSRYCRHPDIHVESSQGKYGATKLS